MDPAWRPCGIASLRRPQTGLVLTPVAEAGEPQEVDLVPRVAVDGEAGEDLADDGAELEAVAREAASDDDLRDVRERVEDEVLVRAVLEEAGLERHRRAGAVGKVALGELTQDRLVVGPRLAVELVRGRALAQVVVAAELEPGDAEDGEAVVAVVHVELEVEDGKAVRRKELGPERLEPREHLPLGL